MHRGPLIIPDANRRYACMTFFPNSTSMQVAKNSCVKLFGGALYNPKIGLQKKRPLRWSETGVRCGCQGWM